MSVHLIHSRPIAFRLFNEPAYELARALLANVPVNGTLEEEELVDALERYLNPPKERA